MTLPFVGWLSRRPNLYCRPQIAIKARAVAGVRVDTLRPVIGNGKSRP
jgi:hypothetical protein